MTPACSSISLFPSAQTKNTRDGPTAAFPKDSILSRMGKPRIQPTISFVISFIPAWAGKLDAAHRQLGGDGPIPTHAGKTAVVPIRRCGRRAHPRSRGENTMVRTEASAEFGSSPLTRGKRRHMPAPIRHRGLIPAHAGKTVQAATSEQIDAAHPRSRGENHRLLPAQLGSSGSSPLTRGEPPPSRRYQAVPRLIPAHAGKTFGCSCLNSSYAAHPRSRGENGKKSFKKLPAIGSSPLTRGKRRAPAHRQLERRLIPAHAGKTRVVTQSWISTKAHPRSRGENDPVRGRRRVLPGSSPLTRGKLFKSDDFTNGKGLIPAHAGKTRKSLPASQLQAAHPRSRGENLSATGPDGLNQGSSPLTRGKQLALPRQRS